MLKARLAAGRTVIGTWVNSAAPEVVETLGLAGFDVVVLDLEHGEFGPEALPGLLRAAAAGGTHALVRASHLAPSEIGRALDAGAEGVVVPNLEDPEQVAMVVAAAHYPPDGTRGAAPNVRAAGYGITPFAAYRERAEADVLVVAQVEGPRALDRIEALLAVPGVDVLFIGPFDLSQHLGVPGRTDHPLVVEAMHGVVEAAGARGVATGTWAPSVAQAGTWIEAGVRFVTVSSSTAMFTEAATSTVSALRRLMNGH
jgi:4-hydroxy-2-oxoheptanedioate aldolase